MPCLYAECQCVEFHYSGFLHLFVFRFIVLSVVKHDVGYTECRGAFLSMTQNFRINSFAKLHESERERERKREREKKREK